MGTQAEHAPTECVDGTERLHAQLDAMRRIQRLGARFVHGEDLHDALADVVETAVFIAGSDFGNIQLFDESTGRLTIVAQSGFPQWWIDFWQEAPQGQGSCGAAMAGEARIIVEDVETSEIFAGTPALETQLRAGVRAVQSTPLVGRNGALLGVLSTHHRRAFRPDEETLRLLDVLARQVADHIEATKLREEHAEREAHYRAAVDTAIDGFLMVDADGRVRDANPAYAKASGYDRNELLGMHVGDLDAEETFDQVAAHIAMIRREGQDTFITRHRRRDGSTWPVEVRSVFWPRAGGHAFTLVRDLSDRLDVEHRIIDAATAEQERMGREIHDGIGQGLTAVSLMVGGLRKRLALAGGADELPLVDALIGQLTQLQREARLLAQGLYPLEIGPDGLADALTQLVESTRAVSHLECVLQIEGDLPRLDPIVGLHLYRIAQEAVGNALRHANAASIRIDLRRDASALHLAIIDDGVGLVGTRSKGVGLSILGYRARSIGAHLTVEMHSSGGTRVACQMPLFA